MKIKPMVSLLMLASSLMVWTSCGKGTGETTGKVSFTLNTEEEVSDVSTKSQVSSFTNLPDASGFTIKIVDSNDGESLVSDPLALTSLATGEYKAAASFGSCSDEGFDKPCFEGTQTFSVQGGKTSTVSIPVKLANCIVRLKYTDSFRKYYSDWNFTLTTGQGNTFSFSPEETKALFIDAYMVTVSGTLTNQGGKKQTFQAKEYRNLAPATCYTMTFDASNIGNGSISISFNNDVQDVNVGEIDLND